jgi:hypothetical protein
MAMPPSASDERCLILILAATIAGLLCALRISRDAAARHDRGRRDAGRGARDRQRASWRSFGQ